MMEYKDFELKVNGIVNVLGFSFQEADQRFAKAMKAIAKRWDIDVTCKERDPTNKLQKVFPLNIKGDIVIDGDGFDDARKLFSSALDSVSEKWDVEIKQGEVNTRYDPPKRWGSKL
jgi:hypothetical protein